MRTRIDRASWSMAVTTPLLPLRTPSLVLFFSAITAVADLELMTADVERVTGELAGQFGAQSAVDVEFGDLGSSTGEHHRVIALCPSGPPVGNQKRLRIGRRVTDGDATVVAVGVEGERGVAVAELVECFAFPFFVLASVVAEFDRGLP